MTPSSLLSLCLVVAASSSFFVAQVSADLYQLVLYSNSEAALDAAVSDSSSILQDWIDEEPSSDELVAVSPGETVTEGGGGGGNRHRGLQLIDCPSRCSNSNSMYCRSIGCAMCGACRRRLGRALGRQSHGQVELKLNEALAPYCAGADSGCQLYVKVRKVNGDGTTDELA
jgi:hypothetical protein